MNSSPAGTQDLDPQELGPQERLHLARALQLAANGLYTTDPNPRVGCVLVRDELVVGEAWHVRTGEPHAEVLALRAAGSRAAGATAFISLEPCSHSGHTPPCADALIAAGITRVLCCTRDPNPRVAGAGVERLRAAGITVSVGGLAQDARQLNVGFFSRHERSRPYVRLKIGMTLDARTTPAGGGSAWITGEEARADVQILRARSSAILTGAGTVRVDDPRLDVRLGYGPWVRQPLRVVLDPELSVASTARIFQKNGALVFASPDARQPSNAHEQQPNALEQQLGSGRRVERVPMAGSGLNLHAVLARLNELEVNELLVECGPRLAGALLQAELVDEMVLYVAPTLLGSDAAPLALLSGLPRWPAFEFHDVRRIGADLRLILRPATPIAGKR